jgi:hypothetical protein
MKSTPCSDARPFFLVPNIRHLSDIRENRACVISQPHEGNKARKRRSERRTRVSKSTSFVGDTDCRSSQLRRFLQPSSKRWGSRRNADHSALLYWLRHE